MNQKTVGNPLHLAAASRAWIFCFAVCAVAVGGSGCGLPSFLVTPVMKTDKLDEFTVRRGTGGKVAVIPIDGIIANARSGGVLGDGENKLAAFEQQLDRAARDSSVRAVVLRINSPGGTVTGSETLYELVRKFRSSSGKPVVASIQEVGASGGYYAALASDRIMACPSSIVGSIGVIFQTISVQGAMNHIGVRSQTIKSGPMKDMGSPFHDMTPGEQQVIQEMVDANFAVFKSKVAEHRRLSPDVLASTTDGRVFVGDRARQLGLIDQVGQLGDAIDLAGSLAGVRSPRAVMYRHPYEPASSMYASSPVSQSSTTPQPLLALPEGMSMPTGMYYLWRP